MGSSCLFFAITFSLHRLQPIILMSGPVNMANPVTTHTTNETAGMRLLCTAPPSDVDADNNGDLLTTHPCTDDVNSSVNNASPTVPLANGVDNGAYNLSPTHNTSCLSVCETPPTAVGAHNKVGIIMISIHMNMYISLLAAD